MLENETHENESDHPEARAAQIYADFSRRIAAGDLISFDAMLAEHPELAPFLDELYRTRSLYSAHMVGALPTMGEIVSLSDGTSDDAQSIVTFEDLAEEALADGYELKERLGKSSGFGVVFRARQIGADRDVAIKFLWNLHGGAIDALFEHEVRKLAACQHPGIVTVFAPGPKERKRPYFAMEYVKGEPITDFVRRRGLGVASRIELIEQVARALAHAHERGIVHRDLKPPNILGVEEKRALRAVVIDFGLAKRLALPDVPAGDRELSAPGGTPGYMCPEQTRGDETGVRSDVYSLGLVLFELLLDRLPFGWPRRPDEDFAIETIAVRLPPTRDETPERSVACPEDLASILRRALVFDAGHRYESMGSFAKDLRAFRADEPVQAHIDAFESRSAIPRAWKATTYRARKFARRSPVAFAGAIVALLVLMALPVWALVLLSKEREYSSLVAAAQSALEASDLVRARPLVERLSREFIGRDSVEPVVLELDRRERERTMLRESIARARDLAGERSDLVRTRRQLEESRERVLAALDDHDPVWLRGEELALTQQLDALKVRSMTLDFDVQGALWRARSLASPGSRSDIVIAGLLSEYWTRELGEARSLGGKLLLPEYFRGMLRGVSPNRVPEWTRIELRTSPPGAAVYCFRYEESDARLVPLPWHPERSIARRRFLRVETVDTDLWPFLRTGDEVETLGDAAVGSETDWVRQLAKLDDGASVAVGYRRDGKLRSATAVFDIERPAELPRTIHSVEELGIRFEAYPLDLSSDSNRLDDGEGSVLRFELPVGSYLLVARRDGFADARVPVSVAYERVALQIDLRLVRSEDVPEGFVYVPGGSLATGGDRLAFQPFEWDTVEVNGFFIGRTEITVAEWREFLNSKWCADVDASSGRAALKCPQARRVLAEILAEGRPGESDIVKLLERAEREKQELVPYMDGEPVFEKIDGRWRAKKGFESSMAIGGVSHLAALEFAAWRSKRDGRVVRLPTDEEWEYASRGADRRAFVWGSFMVWTFCVSGRASEYLPQEPGGVPTDESIFGVRDTNGGLSEHTTSVPLEGFLNRSFRGGNWADVDLDDYFRLASRNSLQPDTVDGRFGLRLLIEIPEQ